MKNAFELKLIPSTKMIPTALSALREHASIFFDSKKIVEQLVLTLEEAIGNVLFFSGSESLREITVSAGTQDGSYCIDVLDEGLPGDFLQTLDGENAIGLTIMRKYADVVNVENLGLSGRRQRIIKYLTSVPEEILSETVHEIEPIDTSSMTFSIRPAEMGDLLEVTRGIYREYGLSYYHDYAYLPEVFYGQIQSGKYRSIVAVSQDGLFGGHHAFWQWNDFPGVYESGMAVVNPRLRNSGIFNMLLSNTNDYYENVINRGVYLGYCITSHPFSQKTRIKFGCSPCAFAFNYLPDTINIGIAALDVPSRSYSLLCRTADKRRKTVWLADELTETAQFIYGMQQLERDIITEAGDAENHASVVKSDYCPRMNGGRIAFNCIGRDYAESLRESAFNLRRQESTIGELMFPASTPASIQHYEEAKKEGFFFAGIIPNADAGDIVVMNRLFSGVVDYSAIHAAPQVQELLDRIKQFNPDNQ